MRYAHLVLSGYLMAFFLQCLESHPYNAGVHPCHLHFNDEEDHKIEGLRQRRVLVVPVTWNVGN